MAKKTLLAFSAFLLLSIAFSCTGQAKGFITAERTWFMDGNEAFFFSGANCYYCWYGNWDCESYDQNQGCSREVLDDAVGMNLTVVRVWGFSDGPNYWGSLQPEPAEYSESGFERYDRLIEEAGNRGLRLVIPLVNNWNDFGGMCQYVEWCNETVTSCQPDSPEHEQFYSSECARGLYKGYVEHFLSRVNQRTGVAYKDDPTIMAWELANEPRSSDLTGDTLDGWIEEMSQYIRSMDSNHLVTVGLEGFGYEKGTDFIRNHDHGGIDYVSFHLLVNDWGLTAEGANEWVERRWMEGMSLGRPIVLSEIGKHDPKTGLYSGVYAIVENRSMAGDIFWMLKDQAYPDFDSYGIDYPEDENVIQEIARHAGWMASRGLPTYEDTGPFMGTISDLSVEEGDRAVVEVAAYDPDGDELRYWVSGNRFVQNGSSFIWVTVPGDAGYHGFTAGVTDGKSNVTQEFHVSVSGKGGSCIALATGQEAGSGVLCPGTYEVYDVQVTGDLDCQGSIIRGNGSGMGIYMEGGSLLNCEISNYSRAVSLTESKGNVLTNNTISDSGDCIYGWHSSGNTITGNVLRDCSNGFMLHDVGSSVFRGNDVQAVRGFRLWWHTENNEFTGNNVHNTSMGFYFDWHSGMNTFRDNELHGNTWAFYLPEQYYGTKSGLVFSGNNISYNSRGFNLGACIGCEISGNEISHNSHVGIQAISSQNATIRGNTFRNNGLAMDMKDTVTGFLIYRNDLLENLARMGVQATDEGENYWHYQDSGNHWSDYDQEAEGCYDSDDDGICDSPYNSSGVLDPYPYLQESGWHPIGDVNKDCSVDILDLAAVGMAYGSSPGGPYWEEDADLNSDGRIDIFDLARVGIEYGRAC